MQKLHRLSASMDPACKQGSGVTSQWLGEHVVPSLMVHHRIHKNVSLVLARPILWACFDDRMESLIPEELRTSICDAYELIRVLDACQCQSSGASTASHHWIRK